MLARTSEQGCVVSFLSKDEGPITRGASHKIGKKKALQYKLADAKKYYSEDKAMAPLLHTVPLRSILGLLPLSVLSHVLSFL